MPTWKNGKHQAQWLSTLENYAFPVLGDRPVDKIEGSIIRDVLAPIRLSKPERPGASAGTSGRCSNVTL